jgi:hypothetical protein
MQAMMGQVIRDTELLLQICASLLREIRQRFPEAQRRQQQADSG